MNSLLLSLTLTLSHLFLYTDAARAYNSDGVEYILDHFDTYFSIIVHSTKLEWNVINKGKHLNKIVIVIYHDDDDDDYLNKIVIVIYIFFCRF